MESFSKNEEILKMDFARKNIGKPLSLELDAQKIESYSKNGTSFQK